MVACRVALLTVFTKFLHSHEIFEHSSHQIHQVIERWNRLQCLSSAGPHKEASRAICRALGACATRPTCAAAAAKRLGSSTITYLCVATFVASELNGPRPWALRGARAAESERTARIPEFSTVTWGARAEPGRPLLDISWLGTSQTNFRKSLRTHSYLKSFGPSLSRFVTPTWSISRQFHCERIGLLELCADSTSYIILSIQKKN